MTRLKKVSDLHTDTPVDVRQLGFWSALGSLGYVFWVAGGMEMIERLAYYGVKTIRMLYAKDPVSVGGLGVNISDFGIIVASWAFVMSFVPVFSGGISDRLGYKKTIFLATVIKIAAYLVMAYFPSYQGFFVGAILLALGTGIFKPGIQGTLAKATNRGNSSMAWGVFYQIINIGGFLGPLLAAQLRQFDWQHVFIACAAIISLNFILLLVYKEPGKEERLKLKRQVETGITRQDALWRESLKELRRPQLLIYLVLFSGFWFMFLALFDVLPMYIDDWVDTSIIVNTIFGAGGTQNPAAIFLFGMERSGDFIKPEGLVNLNAGMIMVACFLVAGLSARIRAIDSMTIGTALCSGALILIGGYNWAWFCVLGIVIFSVGEMLSSPKFLEYLANIAPTSKKAMYLGFSGLPQGIGWTLEGYLGPYWYDHWASKERFARELLLGRGLSPTEIGAIPNGEAFQHLLAFTGQSSSSLTQFLYASHNIGLVWYVMGGVGLISAVGMYFYGRWMWRMALSRASAIAGQG